ncbi:HAD family hydrolase [Paenibacillus barcinonensis]|uniref:HAD family hydrolase n=1 Tax=Paenibacillus barcinonensis TaxID=198119 RepID=A0ABX6Q9Q5_PAEBA|nr:HAD family hydrolase [Paenibacillus barcinonensis]QKS58916.1 HAD family hydrolase [Paenibacillus barcinonensis]
MDTACAPGMVISGVQGGIGLPDIAGLKWLFFDVGDTLVDEWEPVDDIIGQFVREANACGYPVKIEAVRELFAQCYQSYEQWPMKVAIQTYIQDEGHRKQIQDKLKFHKELERPFPSAAKVLEQLSHHYLIGIIANQSPGTEMRLESYGLRKYVHVLACSAEEGVSKPDPELYAVALKQAGCAPEEAVMIGDRIDNDIVPARSLGLHTIRILQGYGRFQPVMSEHERADWTVESLDELLPLLIPDVSSDENRSV